MFQEYQNVLRVEEVAEMLVMGRNGVYELLLDEKLKGFRNGRVWRVPKQAVIEYITQTAGLGVKIFSSCGRRPSKWWNGLSTGRQRKRPSLKRSTSPGSG